jgi:hypothetical protein
MRWIVAASQTLHATAASRRTWGSGSSMTGQVYDSSTGATVGAAARARVIADYDWTKNLAPFDALLQDPEPALRHAAV